jgi:hypothetical protein
MMSIEMAELPPDALDDVIGGYDNPDPGRCGPGADWQFLGDVHTKECLIHDNTIKSYEDQGDPTWLAHIKALPALPAAIGSYFSTLLFGQGPS